MENSTTASLQNEIVAIESNVDSTQTTAMIEEKNLPNTQDIESKRNDQEFEKRRLASEKQRLESEISTLKKKLCQANKSQVAKCGRTIAGSGNAPVRVCPICKTKGINHFYNKFGLIEVDRCFLVRDLDIHARMEAFKFLSLCQKCGTHRTAPNKVCTLTTHPSGSCSVKKCENRFWSCFKHYNENYEKLFLRNSHIKRFP